MLQLENGTAKKFTIPFVDKREDLDCCYRKYRRCIYNTLLALKPKYSLEIGTYLFQSSYVWSRYYEENDPDGKLITADISIWNRGEPSNRVYPVMFYPYEDNPEDEHGGIKVFYENYKEVARKDLSLELNILKLIEKMMKYNIRKFDLTFVDSGHSRLNFLNDLKIAQLVTRQNGYILIDDIYQQPGDRAYEQHKVYQELCRRNKFYEYDDWNPRPGFALIKNKDLVIK